MARRREATRPFAALAAWTRDQVDQRVGLCPWGKFLGTVDAMLGGRTAGTASGGSPTAGAGAAPLSEPSLVPRGPARISPLAGARPGPRGQPSARLNRRGSGGFFRPLPWLQSARELPQPAVSTVTAIAVVVAGIWTTIALITASGHPTLPSAHAVMVSVKPLAGHSATGGGHLIWYRSAGLLVFVLGVRSLPPGSTAEAVLAPTGSCSGVPPPGSRVVGSVRASKRGVASFNEEILGVSSLKFSDWSVWVEGVGQGRSPTACGVVSLSDGSLIGQ